MATYLIEQTLSGVELGTYEADSEQGALLAMMEDAGGDTSVKGWERGLVAREVSAADLALDGIDAATAAGVVLVDDGDAEWLCEESAWDAAVEQLRAQPAPEGAKDDAGMEAYSKLCSAIRGPIASPHKAVTDEARVLARRALDAGLIDEDSWLGKQAAGLDINNLARR